MPGGSGNGMFFSFNVGPVHFVSFSSEYYYFTNFGTKQIGVQYKWLEQDLKVRNIHNDFMIFQAQFPKNNTYNWRPIAQPWKQDMGCLLWV